MKDKSNNPICIFKPIDEEVFAPNNPRGYIAPFGTRFPDRNILSGEACIREVAAYLLDHKRFSGVPETFLAIVAHSNFKNYGEMQNGMMCQTNKFAKETALMINYDFSKKPSQKGFIPIKFGSMQVFVNNYGDSESFSPDLYTDEYL